MNDENFEGQGFCPYCGQGILIKSLVPIESQDELDKMAADRCSCEAAKTERRKKERKKKIDAYLNKHFEEPVRSHIEDDIKLVEGYDIDKANYTLGPRNVSIWLDADAYLHVKIKHKSDDELKV